MNLYDFIDPVSENALLDERNYTAHQVGKNIAHPEQESTAFELADIVFVGCNEVRGDRKNSTFSKTANNIRKEWYDLYYWHTDIKMVDLGDIKIGATLTDTYAALSEVVKEIIQKGKRIVIFGGSHDNTLGQYFAYQQSNKIIECSIIDAKINMDERHFMPSEKFLIELLLSEPNFITHYNHLGFQTYLVSPQIIHTLDKLRFDCYRLGHLRESIDLVEPSLRTSHLISVDIAAMQHSDANATNCSPNGLSSEEMCILMQFCGMSTTMSSLGIYGYHGQEDKNNMTAKQIAQMIWYFIDGSSRGKQESHLSQVEQFNRFSLTLSETAILFLQSKKTARWWMQMPNKQFFPCTYSDYQAASNNELPERWLRFQERYP